MKSIISLWQWVKPFYPYLLIILFITFYNIRFAFNSRILFTLSIVVVLDLYVYNGTASSFTLSSNKWIFGITYWLLTAFALMGVFWMFNGDSIIGKVRPIGMNFLIGLMFAVIITKLIFLLYFSLYDIGRLLYSCIDWVKLKVLGESKPNFLMERRQLVSQIALGIAAIPFLSILYGITIGKYKYTVEKLKLNFKDLPKSFQNFKIVHISDIHAGSFDSLEQVKAGIQMINDQNPDCIVFTGDLVNVNKDEIDPYIEAFSELKAPYGKFATLGNHDYWGVNGLNREEEREYWSDFYSKFEGMGFDLLNNVSRTITSESGEEIKMLGVENWGKGRYFPKRGNLDEALSSNDDQDFRILLSHDPSHWDEKILPHRQKFHLTLSGHTHGMQFGINLPWFKWSPIKYRYKQWLGLYESDDQYLYVNRGFGFLVFPGRVGMSPEITVLELNRV